MDRDEHFVCLLAQGIASDEPLGRQSSAVLVRAVEPLLRDPRERILVSVGQALPLAGEAVVTEAFGQVAGIERDGVLRTAGRVVGARLESGDIQGPDRLRP